MSLKDVQAISLDIMKSFDHFCVTHKLNYSMGFGTLLGAVRHRGFIPWDDDIDIVMLRADYEKFCKAWIDTNDYKLFNYERGNMFAACSRLCDMRRTYVKTAMPLFTEHTGVWIDIFPLDYVEDDHNTFLNRNHLIKEAHLAVLKKRNAMTSWNDYVSGPKSALKWAAKKIIHYKNIMKLVKYQVMLSKYFSLPSNRVCCLSFPTYLDRDYTSVHIFDDYVELPFEDTVFLAMKGYDEYLRSLYGDYMQMPPKEKQIRGHSAHKFYWL